MIPQCTFEAASNMLSSCDDFIATAESCHDEAKEVRLILESIQNFYEVAASVAGLVDGIHKATESFLTLTSKLDFFLTKIPKLKTVVLKMKLKLQEFANKIKPIAEKKPALEQRVKQLGAAQAAIAAVEVTAIAHSNYYQGFCEGLDFVAHCSANNGCSFEGEIGRVASAHHNYKEDSLPYFETCVTVFDPIRISLPPLPSFDLFNKLMELLQKMTAWLEGVVDEISEGASYAMCCDNVLRPITDFTEGLAGIFDLATCWVDGALGVKDAAYDLIFGQFQSVVDLLNHVFGDINGVLNTIGTLQLTLPKLDGTFPGINFDSQTCSFDVTAANVDIGLKTYGRIIRFSGYWKPDRG